MNDLSFTIASYVQDNNRIFFSSQDNIGIYVLDLLTDKIQYKAYFPSKQFNVRFQWGKGIKIKQNIWFSNFAYNRPTCCYDIEKNKVSEINVKTNEQSCQGHPFFHMSTWKGKIYEFPIKEKQILVFNEEKEFLRSIPIDIGENVFTLYAAENQSKVYLPIATSNQIIEFDMETEQFNKIEVGPDTVKIMDILYLEGCLFFAVADNADLYCYSLEEKIVKKVSICNEKTKIDCMSYDGQFLYGTLYSDKLFRIKADFSELEFWDVPTQNIELPENCLWRRMAPLSYRYIFHFQKKLYISSERENKLYIFDKEEDQFVKELQVAVPKDVEDSVNFMISWNQEIRTERRPSDLKAYLNMIIDYWKGKYGDN